MEQFDSFDAVLDRLAELGATRFFFKPLQENDNSKQQIYVAERPDRLAFMHPTWRFDPESAIPKASIDFEWVTPSDSCIAPHAKLIYYPNYPEVRLSGLLKATRLAPSGQMRPVPKEQRTQRDERVLVFGVTESGTLLAHLALPGSAASQSALAMAGPSAVTEVTRPSQPDGKIVASDLPDASEPAFGIIVETPDDEADDEYSDDGLFEISSWGADLSFRELINRYDDDELVKPELQRNYVWDRSEASRFIDSILLGLPVPSIFLAKTKEEKLLIIDGYQRLMTVRDYVKGTFSKDKNPFKLARTEKIHERWRGKLFTELSGDEQRRIRNTTIHAIIFMQQQPRRGDTSLYQIFERINSSGRTLLPQEIRNCVYQGELNSLLIELNNVPAWRTLWGSAANDGRMRDMEFILRFFALSSPEIMDPELAPSRISLKRYLNEYMGEALDRGVSSLRTRFKATVDYIFNALGSTAFHNLPSGGDKTARTSFSPTIFDSVMIATDIAICEGVATRATGLCQRRSDLLKNTEFQALLYQETMRTHNIRDRVNMMHAALYGEAHE